MCTATNVDFVASDTNIITEANGEHIGLSDEQRLNWELIGRGVGIHWEAIDEDISIAGLLGLPND